MRFTARHWFGRESGNRRRGYTLVPAAFVVTAMVVVAALASDEQPLGPIVAAAESPVAQGVQAAREAETIASPPSSTASPSASSSTIGEVSGWMPPIANEMRRVVSTTLVASPPTDSALPFQVVLSTAPPPTSTNSIPAPATTTIRPKNCVVRLHGKGGAGAPTTSANGITYLAPTGNAAGWGGRQWLYYPSAEFAAARTIVANALDGEGCTRVVIDGFSNGAAFAGKLYCSSESFGGRLVRVIIDDPVTDSGVKNCAGASGVAVTLYWTGALEGQAIAGWNCALSDWTCEGGSTIGIAAYAAALRTVQKPSPAGGHSPYTNPPELTQF